MTMPDISFQRSRPDVYGDAHPKALLRAIQEDGDYLIQLANQHIVSGDQFDQQTMKQLFRLAAKIESNPKRFHTPLRNKILISAFYEPSTRTRLSFESAWQDRKSTRLNSSHVRISYAVFCLKKKKNNTT